MDFIKRFLNFIRQFFFKNQKEEKVWIDWNKARREYEEKYRQKKSKLNIEKAPYVSYYEDDLFDFKNQLPIDDGSDATKDFNFDTLKVKDLYRNKKEIVAFLKCKQSVSCEDIEKLVNMRDRMLKIKKPIEKFAIQNQTITDPKKFIESLKKTEFYRSHNFGCVSYLYKDLNAYIDTLVEFINSDDKKSFDFNERYASIYNETTSNDNNNDDDIDPAVCLYDLYDENDFNEVVVIFNEKTKLELGTKKYAEALEFPFYFNISIYTDCYMSLGEFFKLYNVTRCCSIVLMSKYDKFNDYMIYKTFFGEQRVPVNMGLLYYILYKNTIELPQNVRKTFQNYVIHRLNTTKCTLALSKSNFYPQIQVPLPNALFYSCYISTIIFQGHEIHLYQERLKELHPYFKDMFAMLKMCNFNVCYYHIKERAKHIYLYQSIDGYVYQIINTSYETTNRDYYSIRKLKPRAAVKYLDKIFNDIDITLSDHVKCYYSYDGYMPGSEQIHPRTMRPRVVIESNDNNVVCSYEELRKAVLEVTINNNGTFTYSKLENKKLDMSRVVPLYKLFQNYVFKKKRYPKLCDYQKYVVRRLLLESEKICLFDENIEVYVDNVYKNYMEFLNKYDVKEFIEACSKSAKLKDRIAIEGYSDDVYVYVKNVVCNWVQ